VPPRRRASTSDALILQHVGWARGVAKSARSSNKLTKVWRLPLEELESVAVLAMVERALVFRPGPVAFQNFAYRRVFGAVMDFARKLVTRHVKSGTTTINEVLLLDGPAARTASRTPSPESQAAAAEVYAILATLPARMQRVLRMRYLDGLAWLEIAAALGVSEQRAWQIHREALNRAADAAKARGDR
jgi:RNA polymerase sigma factor (sigma-70 family)